MIIAHPDLPGAVNENVPDDEAFRRVWQPRGFVKVDELPDLDEMTVDEVVDDYVAGDPVRLSLALYVERNGRNRVTLINRLEHLAESPPDAGAAGHTEKE